MSFLNPTAFFWLLLAIPIVIFFLLKMRTRRVTVGSVMFWDQVADEKPPRALWLQLRHVVTLLVQLLLLLLLVFSLADPVRDASSSQPSRTVVVLDNSASMLAATDRNTRFERAVAAVQQRINSLNGRQEMALVTAARPPQVLCGLTSHAGVLRDALAKLQCTESPTALREAIAMAEQLQGDRGEAQIQVITDGSGWRSAAVDQQGKRLPIHIIGTSMDNVAVSALQVRRSFRDPLTWQAVVRLQSCSDSPQSGTLDLLLGDELLDVVTVELLPDQSWERVFEFRAAAGGVVSVSLTGMDEFLVDNKAVAVLPPRPPVPVTLVTQGQWFLEQVLAANALVRLSVAQRPPERSTDILVLHGSLPETIPEGPVIVVQPESDTSLWRIDGQVDSPLVGQQQDDNLTRNVRLDNVLMPTAAALQPLASHETLIESAGGTPLLLRFSRATGDVVVLNINLEDSDLPLRTAFPILLGNAIADMSSGTQDLQPAVATGEAVRFRGRLAADDVSRADLTGPDGGVVTAIRSGADWVAAPLTRTGVYSIPASSSERPGSQAVTTDFASAAAGDATDATDANAARNGATPVLAANLLDPQESDLRFSPSEESSATVSPPSSGGRPMWWLIVLLVALMFLVEWGAFHRRWLA